MSEIEDLFLKNKKRAEVIRSLNALGFLGMLCLAFSFAKITGYIHLSWWWLAMPIAVPLFIICFVIVLVSFSAIIGLGLTLGFYAASNLITDGEKKRSG